MQLGNVYTLGCPQFIFLLSTVLKIFMKLNFIQDVIFDYYETKLNKLYEINFLVTP